MEQVAALPGMKPGMKLIYQYWGKVTMLVSASNHTRKIGIISDKSFTDDANPSRLFRVGRIATVMYGSADRCVLLALPLRRKSELESFVAPHNVFVLATEDNASIEVLPLQDVHLEYLQFVCRNAVSWWWNPYVIHFL